MHKIISKSLDDTYLIAKRLYEKLPLGSVICLSGDLGAGKTTLVKCFADVIGIKDKINSPTFNIMKLYLGPKSLIHIDAYRLEDMDHNIGLDEYIGYENGYTFIEWPMFIKELIPENHVSIEIKNIDASTREFCIEGIEL